LTNNANPTPQKQNHTLVAQAKFYSGLIPPPDSMEQYEKILPGSADRILTMTEKQEAHRIKMEEKQLSISSISSKLGLIGGFIIIMTVVLLGGYLIIVNKPIEGFVSLIGGLGILI